MIEADKIFSGFFNDLALLPNYRFPSGRRIQEVVGSCSMRFDREGGFKNIFLEDVFFCDHWQF